MTIELSDALRAFRIRYCSFDGVGSSIVSAFIQDEIEDLCEDYYGDKLLKAILLKTAHELQISGHGQSGSQKAIAQMMMDGVKTLKDGDVSITRDDAAASQGGRLESTVYGRAFVQLRNSLGVGFRSLL